MMERIVVVMKFCMWCACAISTINALASELKHGSNEKSDRRAMFALLFAILATQGSCQPEPRWRILVDRDSLAIGPLNDVRKWAGLRMAKNETARQCAWELAQRGKELSSLYAERAKCDKAQEDARLLIASHAGRIEELSDHNRKLSRKVKRRTPFIPLLVGIVGGFVIHEQLGK